MPPSSAGAAPLTYDLAQNYPNPFNPTTTVRYQVPEQADVRIVIYDLLGRRVRTLVDTPHDAGFHTTLWDGRNALGQRVASGIYIYRMRANQFVRTRKMVLLK